MKRRWSSGAPVHVLHCFSTAAAAAAATAAAAVGGAASFCTYTNFYSSEASFQLLHPKIYICVRLRLILVLVGKKYVRVIAKFCFSATTVPGMIQFTYYVPDTYVPGISRQKSIRTYVVVRMIPTFRPWTHTSDDSYIYQLSLVVATATVSFVY